MVKHNATSKGVYTKPISCSYWHSGGLNSSERSQMRQGDCVADSIHAVRRCKPDPAESLLWWIYQALQEKLLNGHQRLQAFFVFSFLSLGLDFFN